jgi:phytoene dehydrogenase-like protein
MHTDRISYHMRRVSSSPKPRVIIIGGGVAGLAAGVYAQRSGFSATILEKNSYAGGACAMWNRAGYTIEGSMHYLTGSAASNPIHRIWREVGALTDHSVIYQPDPFLTCQYSGQRYCLYRNISLLEEHLISLAPEDTAAIQSLVKDVKKLTPFPSPFTDVPGVRMDGPRSSFLNFALQMVPILPRFMHRSTLSVRQYLSSFTNRGIRELFLNVSDEYFSAGALLFLLASIASGDLSYVRGGSQAIANGMAAQFQSLGGTLLLKQKVDSIQIINGQIKSVSVGDHNFPAEAVIATVDARAVAATGLTKTGIKEPWMAGLVRETRPVIADLLAVGLKADLSSYPYMTDFPLNDPVPAPYHPAGAIKVVNYSGIAAAPPGCCVLTVLGHGTERLSDYWRAAQADGSYEAKKRQWTRFFLGKVEAAMPEIRGKVAFAELSTAATVERYLGTYKGSYMSYQLPGWNVTGGVYPQRSEVVKNLYWAGMRMLRPGGLPPALMTGRKAVQYICKDFGMTFH